VGRETEGSLEGKKVGNEEEKTEDGLTVGQSDGETVGQLEDKKVGCEEGEIENGESVGRLVGQTVGQLSSQVTNRELQITITAKFGWIMIMSLLFQPFLPVYRDSWALR